MIRAAALTAVLALGASPLSGQSAVIRPPRAPVVDRFEFSGFCSHLDCFAPQEWVRDDGAHVYSYSMGQFSGLTSLELVERGNRIVLATLVFFERDRADDADLAAARQFVGQICGENTTAVAGYLASHLTRTIDDLQHAAPATAGGMTLRAGTVGSTRSVRLDISGTATPQP